MAVHAAPGVYCWTRVGVWACRGVSGCVGVCRCVGVFSASCPRLAKEWPDREPMKVKRRSNTPPAQSQHHSWSCGRCCGWCVRLSAGWSNTALLALSRLYCSSPEVQSRLGYPTAPGTDDAAGVVLPGQPAGSNKLVNKLALPGGHVYSRRWTLMYCTPPERHPQSAAAGGSEAVQV